MPSLSRRKRTVPRARAERRTPCVSGGLKHSGGGGKRLLGAPRGWTAYLVCSVWAWAVVNADARPQLEDSRGRGRGDCAPAAPAPAVRPAARAGGRRAGGRGRAPGDATPGSASPASGVPLDVWHRPRRGAPAGAPAPSLAGAPPRPGPARVPAEPPSRHTARR